MAERGGEEAGFGEPPDAGDGAGGNGELTVLKYSSGSVERELEWRHGEVAA